MRNNDMVGGIYDIVVIAVARSEVVFRKKNPDLRLEIEKLFC